MLNLLVMRFVLIFIIVINLFNGWFSAAHQLDLARIISPQEGESLKGVVAIRGTVTGLGFQYAEVAFRYKSSEEGNWFLIEKIEEVVVDETLANWDTIAIADDTYQLRVTAYYEDGHQLEMFVDDIRIHNYTPYEVTDEPDPALPVNISTVTVLPETTATTFKNTPTPMPTNELVLSQKQLGSAFLQGGIFGSLLLFTIGLWIMIRKRIRE